MTDTELQGIKLFSGLNIDEIDIVRQSMTSSLVPSGEFLFREGEEGSVMHVLLSGSVRVSVKNSDGDDVEVSTVPSGSFLGEMSLLERSPRSATCLALDDCHLLSLDYEDFRNLMKENPLVVTSILRNILATSLMRLEDTGSFVTDMVRWGEGASIRAVTDDSTGLYNRRFFDTSIGEAIVDWKKSGETLAVVLMDLDRFGTINAEYGKEKADQVLLAAVPAMVSAFGEAAIISRYGGDEFAIILAGTTGTKALEMARKANRNIRSIDLASIIRQPALKLTASIGISVCPGHGTNSTKLLAAADVALYTSKKKGRDRATVYGLLDEERKSSINSSLERRRIINNILEKTINGRNFLLVGHIDPDEDCFASMVAYALILKKLKKNPRIVFEESKWGKFSYLISICRYNSIKILGCEEDIEQDDSTVIVCDTPKPSMIQFRERIESVIARSDVCVIEIDHHLAADGAYIGNENYRFVDDASSTCELIAELAIRLNRKKNPVTGHRIDNVFTRNIVLAIVIGMIGDAKMGQYLVKASQKRRFRYYSRMFGKMLKRKTIIGSGNISNLQEILHVVERLAGEDEKCFREMLSHKKDYGLISAIALNEVQSLDLMDRYDNETIITAAKYAVNVISSQSGHIGIISYYDDLLHSDYIQIRMRRSPKYKLLDLREILDRIGITNGGGHEGAVGFRVNRGDVTEYESFIESIINQTLKAMGEAGGKHQ